MSHSQDAESTHGSGDDDSYTYYSSYTPFSDRSEDERSEEERSAEPPPQRQSSHNSEVTESDEASPKESASYSEERSEEPPACKERLQKAKEMFAQSMKEFNLVEEARAKASRKEGEARRKEARGRSKEKHEKKPRRDTEGKKEK